MKSKPIQGPMKRGQRPKLRPCDVKRARVMSRSGKTLFEIAVALECSIGTAKAAVRGLGTYAST